MDQPPIPMSSFASQGRTGAVYFDRHELHLILNVYGRMVAAGLWKDYAVDVNADCAVFSVYRRAAETPEYRIIKDPSLAQKQGPYAIQSRQGQILKRGKSLANALKLFERKFLKVVETD